MLILHISIFICMIVFLLYMQFGKFKKIEGKISHLNQRVENALSLYPEETTKSAKKLEIINVIICFLFMIVLYMLPGILDYFIKPDDSYTYLELNRQAWPLISVIFLMIGIIGLTFYPIYSKKYLVRKCTIKSKNKQVINTYRLSELAKEINTLYWLAFVTVIVCYPIYIMGLNQKAYYNSNEIFIQDVFDAEPKIYMYSDLIDVKRIFNYNYQGNVSSVSYILVFDGHEEDILFGDNWNQTLEIHLWLTQLKPELFDDHIEITPAMKTYIDKKIEAYQNALYIIFD